MGVSVLAHPKLVGGAGFTMCPNTWCVGGMHFIKVPLLSYLLIVAVYAWRRFTRATAQRFAVLLGFANVVELVVFVFDGLLLVTSFQRGASQAEQQLYVAEQGRYVWVMSLLLLGLFLGGWVRFRVNDYLNPPLDPRYEHPRTEGELIQLVKRARALGVQLRVRGSGHCVREGRVTDKDGPHINVQLDRYNQIIGWEERNGLLYVTVQAGCHLGVDPGDPLSNKKNSLLWQLDKEGWALPDLGGVSHQTVAGFISTGSMGGTRDANFGGSIHKIRLIDGRGRVRTLERGSTPDENNLFYAAGVSMGLLGVISTVTLVCCRRYDLKGNHITTSATRLLKLVGDGSTREVDCVQKLFSESAFSRLLWWPQEGIDKAEFWTANRQEFDYGQKQGITGQISYEAKRHWLRLRHRFRRRYRPFVSLSWIMQRFVIHPFFNFIARTDPLPYEPATKSLVLKLLKLSIKDETKDFRDSWHTGLPMDDQISDKLVPMVFTEMFIDINRTDEVIKLLHDYFSVKIDTPFEQDTEGRAYVDGLGRTGAFALEVYTGHKSDFWLSPCYGQSCIRVDVFWFSTRTVDDMPGRDEFFEQFWMLLLEKNIDFRLHWGKYLPKPASKAGASARKAGASARYLATMRERYSQLPKFLEERKRMDPQGIFLNKYWKEHLGITGPWLDYAPQELVDERVPGPMGQFVRRRRTVIQAYGTKLRNLGRRVWIHILIGLINTWSFVASKASSSRRPNP